MEFGTENLMITYIFYVSDISNCLFIYFCLSSIVIFSREEKKGPTKLTTLNGSQMLSRDLHIINITNGVAADYYMLLATLFASSHSICAHSRVTLCLYRSDVLALNRSPENDAHN